MASQTQTSPLAGSSRSRRKISWDLVRAGCVTLVVLYHSTYLGAEEIHPELLPRKLQFPFQVGASMLLVISAYFACVTIGKSTTLRYWCGRMARLIPPFLGALVIIFVFLRLFNPPGYFDPTVRQLAANMLMLWQWYPPEVYPFLDGSHWTVPLQLMGFTFAALLYRSRLGHGVSLRVVLWAAVLLPMLQWPLRVSHPPEWYSTLVDGFGAHRWHLFVAGVAVWLWSTKRIGALHFAGLSVACMAAHALHNHVFGPEGTLEADWGSTYAVWVGILFLAFTAHKPDWGRVVPKWTHRPIQWFAGISYGVFLMHQAIGYTVMRRLQDLGIGPTLQTLAMIVTGVLLGWVLTRLVETPSYKFLMNTYDRCAKSRKRRTAQPTPAAQPADTA